LKLVGTQSGHIVSEVEHLLSDPAAYAAMAKASNPFGDGQSARRIVDALLRFV
jgi:UDP-N-acetylglucosamine 2-epimerase (non-hydrolysing)